MFGDDDALAMTGDNYGARPGAGLDAKQRCDRCRSQVLLLLKASVLHERCSLLLALVGAKRRALPFCVDDREGKAA